MILIYIKEKHMIGLYIIYLYIVIAIYPAFAKGFDKVMEDLVYVGKTTIIMLTIMLAKVIKFIKWIKSILKKMKKKI